MAIRGSCGFRSRSRRGIATLRRGRASGSTASTSLVGRRRVSGVEHKQRLQRFARLPGGQIATAHGHLRAARAGVPGTSAAFGDDELGTLSRESLSRAGVDISAARTVAGATNQFAVILVDARSGERTVLWDRHPALTMDPADVPQGRRDVRTDADRRLPRNGRGDAGGAIRARGRDSRPWSTSRRCGRASPICCRTSTPSSRRRNFRPR